MKHQMLASAFAGLALAAQPMYNDAPVINPATGSNYIANFPTDIANKNIRGSVSILHNDNGPVHVKVDITGLPSGRGPFSYHIHEYPVGSNNNCTATGAHFDPYMRGETPACDPTQPSTCQLGDLAGKHGKITSSAPFTAAYDDQWLSTSNAGAAANDSATLPLRTAFVGQRRSVVVHLKDKTRVACADLVLVNAAPARGNVSVTGVGAPGATATTGLAGGSGGGGAVPTTAGGNARPATATGTAATARPTSGASSRDVAGLGLFLGGAVAVLLA